MHHYMVRICNFSNFLHYRVDRFVGYYINAMGLRNFLILMACTSCYAFFVTFPQYWLQKWTEAPADQMRYYIGGYLISSLLAWISTNGSMW
jgi:ATP-binding cassette subfamily C (CFTR/MRP) protein 1